MKIFFRPFGMKAYNNIFYQKYTLFCSKYSWIFRYWVHQEFFELEKRFFLDFFGGGLVSTERKVVDWKFLNLFKEFFVLKFFWFESVNYSTELLKICWLPNWFVRPTGINRFMEWFRYWIGLSFYRFCNLKSLRIDEGIICGKIQIWTN